MIKRDQNSQEPPPPLRPIHMKLLHRLVVVISFATFCSKLINQTLGAGFIWLYLCYGVFFLFLLCSWPKKRCHLEAEGNGLLTVGGLRLRSDWLLCLNFLWTWLLSVLLGDEVV